MVIIPRGKGVGREGGGKKAKGDGASDRSVSSGRPLSLLLALISLDLT